MFFSSKLGDPQENHVELDLVTFQNEMRDPSAKILKRWDVFFELGPIDLDKPYRPMIFLRHQQKSRFLFKHQIVDVQNCSKLPTCKMEKMAM